VPGEVLRVPVTVGVIKFDVVLMRTLVLMLITVGGASGVTWLLIAEVVVPELLEADTVKV
jgi:hypothetical protein